MPYGQVNVDKVVNSDGTITGGLYGFKNRIINGAMVIDQRNAGALVAGATGNIYGVDRTAVGVFGSGTGRISAQQSSSAPTGFTNSLVGTVTTADASPSAAYGYCVCQRIEGYNVADFGFGAAGASTITVSFWVRASITGSYVLTLQNENADRSYTTLYTINSANTWEYKTVTVAGDTTGTWFKTNAAGLIVYWGLGGGSARLAPSLNAWSSGVAGAYAVTVASGSVNWIANNGATFYITGAQVEKGSVATTFDYRPYPTELALCQRYYEKSYSTDVVPGTATANGCLGLPTGYISGPIFNTISLWYRVEKRAAPSVSYYDVAGTASVVSTYRYSDNVRTDGVSSSITISPSTAGAFFRYTTNVSGAALQWVASIEL